MPTLQRENKRHNNQGNISPIEHNSIIAGSEYCHISETQEKDLKVPLWLCYNRSSKMDWKNAFIKSRKIQTSSVRIRKKRVQDLNMEIKSIRKIKTEENMEMKKIKNWNRSLIGKSHKHNIRDQRKNPGLWRHVRENGYLIQRKY